MKIKLSELSIEYLKKIFIYNFETRELFWKISKGKRTDLIGKRAGWVDHNGYRNIEIDGIAYKEHQIIWFIETGKWPLKIIDHENRIKTDNMFKNLRLATSSQNCANSPKSKNNTSGYKGVTWHKQHKKWYAQISKDRKNYFLGLYFKAEEAALAYNKKALELFGEFAYLNDVKIL